jgi:ElaB/YqjD/DUF883 family membrane-anchored ribosome-binding protein
MNQTDIANVAAQAAQKSKTIVGREVERQAASLGKTLSQTARDLQQVGNNLRSNGTVGSAAQVADWAAGYVDRAGTYLSNGNSDRFIADIETTARERPWTIVTTAAALGFLAARVVKSSSVRRYAGSGYDGNFSGGYGYTADTRAASPAPTTQNAHGTASSALMNGN